MTNYIAEKLAEGQKEIAVSEFFERNKHILGFDSPTRALITAVKEAVDNSLDACEEAKILPDIYVEIKKGNHKDEFIMIVQDNGPGLVRRKIGDIFGRLLYGSRFHAIKQSRGQQGIGISATVMYGQITTGKHTTITTKIGPDAPAYKIELYMDTKNNRAVEVSEEVLVWEEVEHGTKVEIPLRARYVKDRRQSVMAYLRGVAIVTPYARIVFVEPDGQKTVYERVSDELPPPALEVKPHPLGIELGTIMSMAKNTKARKLGAFLTNEFSRVSPTLSKEICAIAGLDYNMDPKSLTLEEVKAMQRAFSSVKIMAPETNCLSPIGASTIKKGLKNVLDGLRPEYYAPPVTRPPTSTAGHPFQVEVGLVYGGELPVDSQVEILRYANRVPLMYQQGDCVSTKAVENIDWRKYGLEQRGGKGIPYGPAIILVHVASTNVPFTSESKEAIANIDDIRIEIENALRVCARKLHAHLNKALRKKKARDKFKIVQKVLPSIAEKASSMLDRELVDLDPIITKIMGIIYVEDNVETKDGVKGRINITNYTTKARNLKVILEVPSPDIIRSSNMDLEVLDEEHVVWDIKELQPGKRINIEFDVNDTENTYDDNIVYVDGANTAELIGASVWQGV